MLEEQDAVMEDINAGAKQLHVSVLLRIFRCGTRVSSFASLMAAKGLHFCSLAALFAMHLQEVSVEMGKELKTQEVGPQQRSLAFCHTLLDGEKWLCRCVWFFNLFLAAGR